MARAALRCTRFALIAAALVLSVRATSATSLDLSLRLDEKIADTVSLHRQPFAVDPVTHRGLVVWRDLGAPPQVALRLSHWRLDQTHAFGVSASVPLPIRH